MARALLPGKAMRIATVAILVLVACAEPELATSTADRAAGEEVKRVPLHDPQLQIDLLVVLGTDLDLSEAAPASRAISISPTCTPTTPASSSTAASR